MTDYAPVIDPIGWDNSWSRVFVDLLSICAAASVVFLDQHGVAVTAADAVLGRRAKQLMTLELVARLSTGSAVPEIDNDPLVDPSSSYIPIGPSIADDFAMRATAPKYRAICGTINRFSVPVPRANGLDTMDLFVQADAVLAYETELPAVRAAAYQLVSDVAAQAALNVAQDPTAAATAAAALAASRAGYVTQLQAAYPTRGYA